MVSQSSRNTVVKRESERVEQDTEKRQKASGSSRSPDLCAQNAHNPILGWEMEGLMKKLERAKWRKGNAIKKRTLKLTNFEVPRYRLEGQWAGEANSKSTPAQWHIHS